MTANALQIGTKVKYEGKTATVVGYAEPFGSYPVVVLEFQAIYADGRGQLSYKLDTRQVVEFGLTVIG